LSGTDSDNNSNEETSARSSPTDRRSEIPYSTTTVEGANDEVRAAFLLIEL
jgi:hypothetical protein